jgi:hypothetical protein
MDSETRVQKPLHSLIPLTDFKASLGVDDREDCLYFASMRNISYEFLQSKNSAALFQPPSLAAFCLLTATYTIEQYCRRFLFVHRHFERFEYAGDLLLTLREYPVREVLALYALYHAAEPELVEPELYAILPEPEPETEDWPGPDIPHTLRLSPVLGRLPGLMAFKVVYRAGYTPGKAPADLASACLELAAWNMSRYKGRRIGMTGNVRGSGKDGEHLETSMPENVRLLLEPYRRRVI